jgi:hypothetical protein
MACESACITVSANWLPGQKRHWWVREGRVGQAPLGRHDGDRPDQARIDRDVAVDLSVQKHRADGEPDHDVGGAFQRHVDRQSGTCGAVPVRSTKRLSSFLVMVTTIGSSFLAGSSPSR